MVLILTPGDFHGAGLRATVVRLDDGSLWVHSPVGKLSVAPVEHPLPLALLAMVYFHRDNPSAFPSLKFTCCSDIELEM